MKNILTTLLGGHPITFEKDIEFIQEQIVDLVKGILGHLVETAWVPTVLNGCEMSVDVGGTVSMTEGWVYVNYYGHPKIYKVEAHQSIPTGAPGENLYWKFVTSYDARGNKTFEDQTVKDTFYVRKLTTEFNTSGFTQVSNSHYYKNRVGVPIGGIIMWSGSYWQIPYGFALCDGQTREGLVCPDLRTKMTACYSDYAGHPAEYKSMGPKNTGNNSVQLAEGNIPSHRHDKGSLDVPAGGTHYHGVGLQFSDRGNGNYATTRRIHSDKTNPYVDEVGTTLQYNCTDLEKGQHDHTIEGNTGYYGGSPATAIDNRPEFYTLAYIIRYK